MGALMLLLSVSMAPAFPVPLPPSTLHIAEQIGDEPPASIGTATMLADGTVVLNLTARGHGVIGHGQFTYLPNHPQYREVIRHVGGLHQGETKSVPPWPDK